MSELRNLLQLWDSAQTSGEEIIVVTVVRVEGSSYRKPGARMLLTKSGRRSGMISGGCLEAEVSRKAWWLTEAGPCVQSYGTFFDDDNPAPQALGCGGIVHLLLERGEAGAVALETIRESALNRKHFALLTVIESNHPRISIASRLVMRQGNEISHAGIALAAESGARKELVEIASQTLKKRQSSYISAQIEGHAIELFVEYIAPPPAFFIFGAGDDAIPVVEFASMMGWHITLADSRSHLATTARFPKADKILRLNNKSLGTKAGVLASESLDFSNLVFGPNDAAVIMTHSYVQDRALLRELLPRELTYLGLLGPRLRTSQLVGELSQEIGLTVDECNGRLHSPAGMNLGGEGPSAIALSIIAQVQAAIHAGGSSGLRRTPEFSTDPSFICLKLSA